MLLKIYFCFFNVEFDLKFFLIKVIVIFLIGYLFFFVSWGFEIVEEESNLIEWKCELFIIKNYRGNFSKRICKEGDFEDILLVIVFVEIFYDLILLLEWFYRYCFLYIVYCGFIKLIGD